MECEKVGGKVEELVKIVTERQAMKKKQQVNGKGDLQQLFKSAESSKTQEKQPISSGLSETNDTGRNLLRLLSQNDNGGPMGGANPVMEGIKLNNGAEPEKTSASVQDFFAKAVSSEAGSSAFTSVPPGPVTMAPMFSQSQAQAPIMALPISQGLAQGMVPVGGFQVLGGHPPPLPGPAASSGPGMDPMVQKLMSNPGIHSVDAIEAEQRQSASPPDLGSHVTMTPKTKNISDLESDLKKKLQIGSGRFLDNNNDRTFAPVQEDSVNGPRAGHVKLLSPQAFSRPTASPSPPPVQGVSPPVGQITPLTQVSASSINIVCVTVYYSSRASWWKP